MADTGYQDIVNTCRRCRGTGPTVLGAEVELAEIVAAKGDQGVVLEGAAGDPAAGEGFAEIPGVAAIAHGARGGDADDVLVGR